MVAILILMSLAGATPGDTAADPALAALPTVPETASAVQKCLAKRCSPQADMRATLKHAKALMAEGSYKDAMVAIEASLKRNKAVKKRYPVSVSNLYRHHAQISASLGLGDDYYRSTWNIYRTLKQAFPNDHVRVLSARMEVAEMMRKVRGNDASYEMYRDLVRDARKRGKLNMSLVAEVQKISNFSRPGPRWMKRLREIGGSTDPALEDAAIQAKIALGRIYLKEKDETRFAALQEEFRAMRLAKPQLIHSPPYDLAEKEMGPGDGMDGFVAPSGSDGAWGAGMGDLRPLNGLASTRMLEAGHSVTNYLAPGYESMWADIGFWVTPDGKVADVKILRSKGNTFWATRFLESVKARRYTPGNGDPKTSYFLERYTYTASYQSTTGTRLQSRSAKPRIEFVDLRQ
ncbi:MAG TPA: hypothetical protein VK403_05995 [Allosphingosinicella sp.]|nr:hypothetical protein [Allosphingosinicella sp.]